MLRYFVAANLWLLWTLLLIVASTPVVDPGEASARSFFGVGRTPSMIYFAIIVGSAAVSILYFSLYARGRHTGPRRIAMPAPANHD